MALPIRTTEQRNHRTQTLAITPWMDRCGQNASGRFPTVLTGYGMEPVLNDNGHDGR
ncbi:MAG: hypothetical protein ACFCVB_00150 [Nodosilinea sp.]